MSKFNNIIGDRFGRLVVLSPTKNRNRGSVVWKCLCDCGNEVRVSSNNLITGSTQSCGCIRIELLKSGIIRRTHGMRHNSIYYIWCSMKERCLNPKNAGYHRYGGRGIKISSNWIKFEKFFKDMGETYKKGLQIDRINNNKNYCKENCRWVTSRQNNNNRRDNIKLKYNNEEKTLSDWARKLGLKRGTVYHRIRISGWDIKKALTTKLLKNQFDK